MDRENRSEAARLNRFLQEVLSDIQRGKERSVEEYQARHPELAASIPRELERLHGGAEAAMSTRLDVAGTTIGPYVLERELGRGGQGAVFLARDTRLERRVALKLLLAHASWSRASRERFHREAALAARLDHPGLCTVYESGEADGVPFVALRFVEGETLAQRLSAGPLEPRAAAEVVARAARALHVAHEAHIAHRDVKPANLMLARDGGVVVLDFGLARDLEGEFGSLTRTGDFFGTPAYMAPEQLEPTLGAVDPRTDVWALGATLAEAVGGRPAFASPTRAGLYRAILEGRAELAPGLPRDLEVILRTALAPAREHRYASALALAEDLEAFRAGRPIAARAVRSGERLVRWARRNRRLAGALAFALLALVAGTVGTTIGWLRAKEREVELAAAKGVAEDAADRATALNAYLARMIESPSPLRGVGRAKRDVTVGEMLDNASETIAHAFPGRPALEAETRLSIGSTYSALGRHADALEHYEAALALLRGVYGERHVDVARARRMRATMLAWLGRRDEAVDELERTLELLERLGGDHRTEVARLRTDLGWVLVESERFEEARDQSAAAVEWLAHEPDGVYEFATATNNLAMSLRALGDFAGAEAAYGRADALFTKEFGEGSALAGVAIGNLAFLLEEEGRHEEALARYEEAVTALRETVGDHPVLGSILLGFARALFDQGDYARAEPICAEARRVLLSTMGESDEEYGIAVELGGFLCSYLNRLEEAEAAYRLSARLLREYHDDPGRALISDAWAAETLCAAGAGERGLAELEELWPRALEGREPSAEVPQAIARAGVRAAGSAGDGEVLARWRRRVIP
ncbi:MAG TPA: serine/threonine protein kinase [Planctomycetes bacterium]|nr:serine/threonine protein kinase [Planctomycetota bacterium]